MDATPPAPPAAPLVEIRIENLHKAFDDNRVLRGIDLEIREGEMVAIVGGSGCGKTVLVNHVLGQLTPDRGRVLVADHSETTAKLKDIAILDDSALLDVHTHWGVVFQRNALFSGSVLDNIALWLRDIKNLTDKAIVIIARRVLKAVALPNDDGFLDTPTESLSGGMAKRLAVARALSMDPAVMFYDEPTTGLDPTSASQIQDLILATHGGRTEAGGPRTTLIITHDKDLLSRLEPRTVMLHEGRIAFDGPFAEFKAARSPIIRPYFDLMPVLNQRVLAAAPAPAPGPGLVARP
ncbi:MAG: ATP-binding cassette domain-containing protein [Rhodospirillales bacterium]|nr:ATP-binding cassette domain-containing protein [Rhodospirillales bacterium]